MVTGRNKTPLEDHFDRNYELEDKLEGDAGKLELLDRVRESTDLATVHYVRQKDPRGLGHAVLCARAARRRRAVRGAARRRPDRRARPAAAADDRRAEAARRFACSRCCEVPHEQISLYGCRGRRADRRRATSYGSPASIEKPPADEAPSNLAIIGRYVLAPEIFDVLRETPPGRGGEIQLTDAINTLCGRDDDGGPVHGVVFRGRRYDTGDKADYLRAIVQLAVRPRRSRPGRSASGWGVRRDAGCRRASRRSRSSRDVAHGRRRA